MRADRLISLMLLLQSRGRLTAAELAEELEVSERTVYRDMEALSASGVPVYADLGPGGGFSLLDSYRTSLTGMNQDELRALFMLSIPGPLERLGVSQELRSALLKLSASLPGERRIQEDLVKQRFYLDWDWWYLADEPAPFLKAIQQAVWEDRRLLLRYQILLGPRPQPVETIIDPYGLVAKAGVWFLVAIQSGQPRVYRVADLTDVRATGECFSRLPGFDLAGFWKAWCRGYERETHGYMVTLRVSPDLLRYLPLYFGYDLRERMTTSGRPEPDGWVRITIPFGNLEAARGKILSCGGAVEVIEPEALRLSIIDQAQHILRRYSPTRQ